MKKSERIAELERIVASLELRLAMVEARPFVPYPNPAPVPYWPITVWNADNTASPLPVYPRITS